MLARCNKHGDAILDRLTALKWLHAKRAPKVRVSFPLSKYLPLDHDYGAQEVRREQAHCPIGAPQFDAVRKLPK